MNILKKYNNSSLVYYLLGEIISKASPFLMLPLISNAYGLTSAAYYSNVLIYANVIQMLVTGWIVAYIPISYIKSVKRCKILIRMAMMFNVALLAFFSSISFFFESSVITYSLILSCGYSINSMFLIILQVKGEAKNYVSFNTYKSITILMFSGLLVYYNLGDINYIVNVNIACTLIFAAFSICKLYSFGYLSIGITSYKLIVRVVKFGFPLIPGMLLVPAKSIVDRFFISDFFGTEIEGIYVIAFQYSLGVSLIAMSYVKSITPELLAGLNQRKKDIVATLFYKYIMFVIVTSCFLILFIVLGRGVLFPNYNGSIDFLVIFIASVLFQVSSSFMTSYYQVKLKTKILMVINCLFFVINIVALYFFGSFSIVIYMLVVLFVSIFQFVALYKLGFKNAI